MRCGTTPRTLAQSEQKPNRKQCYSSAMVRNGASKWEFCFYNRMLLCKICNGEALIKAVYKRASRIREREYEKREKRCERRNSSGVLIDQELYLSIASRSSQRNDKFLATKEDSSVPTTTILCTEWCCLWHGNDCFLEDWHYLHGRVNVFVLAVTTNG